MNHYDENIIELYALGSKEVLNERNEIEKHLKECYSCAEVFNNIKSFYNKLESNESNQITNTKLIANKSVVIKPSISRYNTNSSVVPKTIISKTFYLIRTQPVKATFSIIGALAIFIFGLNFTKLTGIDNINQTTKDFNPALFISNDSTNTLQIYNRYNEKLFELPYSADAKVGDHRTNYNVDYTQVADLDGDGENELISILPGLLNQKQYSDSIKVFDHKGKLINKAKLGRSVKYLDKWLEDRFNAFCLIVEDFDDDGTKEIYVGTQSRNSPYVLVKYDCELNKIGEYWHHGWFWGMNSITLNGKMGILLCGLNDVIDDKAYPVSAFIDPKKIEGTLQSFNTPVFNNMCLLKEDIYKQFPRTWISDSLKHKPRINNLISTSFNTIKISYLFSAVTFTTQFAGLELTLDQNFNVVNVFGGDSFKRIWGISQPELNKAFIEEN